VISLSTCWRAKSGLTGREIVDLYGGLGFRFLEVEYRLSFEQVDDIAACVREGRVSISSVHNYVPKIPGEGDTADGGDRFLLSSLDEASRRQAVEKTRRTLEWCERLASPAVVLHLGRVEAQASQHPLLDLVRADDGDSKEADEIRRALVDERARAAGPHLDQVVKSVKEIQKVAADLGIRVGLENRYYYRQIPSPEELEVLLAETDRRVVGYWHDVGHGQVMEAMGLRGSLEHLEKAGDRLIGVHLHDIRGVDDHAAPGTGEFDFEILRPWLRPDTLRVVELHPRVTEEEVVQGREFLESQGLLS